MKRAQLSGLLLVLSGLIHAPASAEILAMMNYESMPPESVKALKLSGGGDRREGIAIIDVDPRSPGYGRILWNMPLDPTWTAHHIFYNPAQDKAYVTFLTAEKLGIMDLKANPYRMRIMDVKGCKTGEDVVFSEDGATWYLTCMGSERVIVGDAATDTIKTTIRTRHPYPHGFDVRDDLKRALVTSTVDPLKPEVGGEHLDVIDTRTHKVIDSVRLSNKPEGNDAPVEILFMPGSDPAVAYVTNMYGNALWTVTWNKRTGTFDAAEVYDFTAEDAGLPLEMYFNENNTQLYVTTAMPGKLHVFDLDAPGKPRHVKTLPTGGGAHHVAFDTEGRYMFVQNSFINLPNMHEGTVTIIDRKTLDVVGNMTTLKDRGLTPNSIVLIPEQNFAAGH